MSEVITTRIVYARHGQSESNQSRTFQGQLDSPLTELGHSQAEALGQRLADDLQVFSKIYCSTLLRTRQTAEGLNKALLCEIEHNPLLREIDLSPWEGLTFTEAEQEFSESYHHFWNEPHRFAVAGAETFLQVQQRALSMLEHFLQQHAGETLLVVSHGAFIQTLITHHKQRPLSELWQESYLANCGLYQVDYQHGRDYKQGDVLSITIHSNEAELTVREAV